MITRRTSLTYSAITFGLIVLIFMVAWVSRPQLGNAADASLEAWRFTGSMSYSRYDHTATLLPDGRVLAVGGSVDNLTAEVYDPARGTWAPTNNLINNRDKHTATLLADGHVLVCGGNRYNKYLSSCELYNPVSGGWSLTGSLNTERKGHTATLLLDGRVLIAGGRSMNSELASAEIYDPKTGTWRVTNPMSQTRQQHTATLLPDGRVLVAGGGWDSVYTRTEIFDPVTELWTPTGSSNRAYMDHTATRLLDGRVLVTGGSGINTDHQNAEIYDVISGVWSQVNPMQVGRQKHTATLLPDGRIIVTGGEYDNESVEVYDLISGEWTFGPDMNIDRSHHTSTLLPGGRILVIGGGGGGKLLSSAEIFTLDNSQWTSIAPMNQSRTQHTATLLLDGRVLVSGGGHSTSEVFNPLNNTWNLGESMHTVRSQHTSTLLLDGRVLTTGGYSTSPAAVQASAELYDPLQNQWITTGSMSLARRDHTATLMPNGRVLVIGGNIGADVNQCTTSVELYDPAKGTWNSAIALSSSRCKHTATLLADGRVLVAGGYENLNSAVLYDPLAMLWQSAANLNTGRREHSAVLLPDGRVLVAGGVNGAIILNSAEIYDPTKNTWTTAAPLNQARRAAQAILLPDGRVLLFGGWNQVDLDSAEIYDPSTNTWFMIDALDFGRQGASITLLLDGRVLAAGGSGLAAAEVYNLNSGSAPAWRPALDQVDPFLVQGGQVQASGSGWRGFAYAEGSSGSSQSSATNYPVLQLRRLDNAQIAWLLPDPLQPFSETTLTTQPVYGFPGGPALTTIFVNGIPSVSKSIQVQASKPATVYLPMISKPCEIYLNDDFSNPGSGWPVGDDGQVRVEYFYGEYRILVRPTEWGAGVSPNSRKTTEFVALFDVRNLNGIYGSYGMAFNIEYDWSRFYTFEIFPDGNFGLYLWNPDSITILAEGFSSAINKVSATNKIRIDRVGGSIKVYVNGQLVVDTYDNSNIYNGGYGLVAFTYHKNNLEVYFDNFTIYSGKCVLKSSPDSELTQPAVLSMPHNLDSRRIRVRP